MTKKEAIKTINEILENNYLSIGECRLFEYEKEAMKVAVEALEQQEIIRCKDCVNLMRPHICRLYMSNCDLDFYCANARRKEE